MNTLKLITAKEIETFAKEWYKKLDVHAPMVDILPMLSDKELDMVFPEATLHGLASFESWYQGVIRFFFDEVHLVKQVKSKILGDKATVKVVVQWEASRWKPPARFSDRIVLDAYQTWMVKRSSKTQNLVITKYIVDKIKYHKGSAVL